MLNFRKLRTDIAPNTVKAGKALWQEKKIEKAEVHSLSSTSLVIRCVVIGKFEHKYQQELEIDRQDSTLIDAQCSCADGFDCQHIAAVTFHLEEHLESMLVAYSKEGAIEEEDEEEKEKIIKTIEEAQQKEHAKKAKKHEKEMLEEYNKASFLLSHIPFFLPEDKVGQEMAELSILLNLPEKKRRKSAQTIEFQLALRLPFRQKPILVQNIKELFDAVQYQEPIWIQHKRYFLPTSSFEKESEALLKILLSHGKVKEGDKHQKIGYIDQEIFGNLLATSFELSQREEDGDIHELPCLFTQSFDERMKYSTKFAKIKFYLQFVQSPLKALLLDPHFMIHGEETMTLEQVTLLDCAKPGMIKDGIYYRFPEKIKRKHLKSLEEIRNMAIPEPHFGTFVENSLPELLLYAEVDNKKVLEKFVTYPFAGHLGGICHIHYLDGELEASIDFVYDEIKIPYASAHVKIDTVQPFVSNEGILGRDLIQEQKIIDDLFEDFAFDQKSGMFKVKSDKKIVEFMTETIPRYQKQILFHCPENLLEQFIYDDTQFKLVMKDTSSVDTYEVELEVKGPLRGITVNELWDCIATKKAFIEVPQEKKKRGKKGQGSKFLVLNLEKMMPIVQIFDEIGINLLDNHKESRPLWSLVTVTEEHFEPLPISFSMTERLKALREQMLGNSLFEAKPIPVSIKAEPRHYQVEGVNWLERLRYMHLNGILADDMGLGKTLQAIIAVTQYHQEHKEAKSMVVCPTSLIYNWKEEFNRFNAKVKVLCVDGTPQQRKKLINDLSSYDVVVTSYSLMQKDIEYYKEISFGYAILDEAQHIKNRTTRNAKSVKSLVARHRLILTGTPVENALEELWSLFDFLMPGLLSSYDRFVEKYIRVPRAQHKEVMENLKNKISPFILRRMKKDVLSELPPVNETVYHCTLTEPQKALYRSYANSAREELSQLVKKEGFDKVQIHVLATLTRLKQICCHPAIFAKDQVEDGDSAKYELLMELLEGLLRGKHKTVIFSQYTRMLQILREDLKERGISFCYLDGSTKNRLDIVKEFNQNESIPIFLVSLKAGGSGLNLTGADTVVHYDMWWNPAVENQATDRVHRMGQKKSVSSYKLVTKGTIEEKIVEMQKRKRGLVKQVVSTDDEAMSKLTWEEVLELLQT